jgi:hypothetical protein
MSIGITLLRFWTILCYSTGSHHDATGIFEWLTIRVRGGGFIDRRGRGKRGEVVDGSKGGEAWRDVACSG